MNFQNLKERDALPAKLKSYDDSKLISQFDMLVKTERKITYHILTHINEIERRRLPAQLGYPSTHMYLVKAHGYSEASAQRRIQSARLLRQIPEVGESIVAGRLNMTQLSQVQMMVRQKQSAEQVIVSAEEKISLISAIESKTSFETELILSKALDVPIKKLETARPQQDDSLRLEMTLSADLLKKMEQVKSLFSHVKHNPSWSELLELLADFAISKKSASRSVRERKSQLPDCESITENNEEMLTRSRSVAECSRYIPGQIRRDLLKQNPCCQFVSPVTGVKCKSRFQLQIDHVVPFSVSGDSSVANLRVLCRAHNLSEAAQWGLNIPH